LITASIWKQTNDLTNCLPGPENYTKCMNEESKIMVPFEELTHLLPNYLIVHY
jgi:hypothetical protein